MAGKDDLFRPYMLSMSGRMIRTCVLNGNSFAVCVAVGVAVGVAIVYSRCSDIALTISLDECCDA